MRRGERRERDDERGRDKRRRLMGRRVEEEWENGREREREDGAGEERREQTTRRKRIGSKEGR